MIDLARRRKGRKYCTFCTVLFHFSHCLSHLPITNHSSGLESGSSLERKCLDWNWTPLYMWYGLSKQSALGVVRLTNTVFRGAKTAFGSCPFQTCSKVQKQVYRALSPILAWRVRLIPNLVLRDSLCWKLFIHKAEEMYATQQGNLDKGFFHSPFLHQSPARGNSDLTFGPPSTLLSPRIFAYFVLAGLPTSPCHDSYPVLVPHPSYLWLACTEDFGHNRVNSVVSREKFYSIQRFITAREAY